MERTLLIIDGNSLINRAYYAMRNPMITSDGVYTQGIYGFLNMLLKLLKEYDPGYAAVAWDRKTPTFRHEEYDAYKAGRKKMPPELAMEIPVMKDILTAMGISVLETDRYEADDIIGTVAGMGEEADLEPLIVTGDRDALQLCTDVTKVLITRKGISEFDLYDREKMLDVYGITPEQFVDLKGLMGDSSDNLPGIPGVGEKTGLKLIKEFGSVEELLRRSDEIKPDSLRKKVQENYAVALMSRKLAKIITDVPLGKNIEELKRGPQDDDALIAILSRLQFNSFLKRMDLRPSEPGDKSREHKNTPPESGTEPEHEIKETGSITGKYSFHGNGTEGTVSGGSAGQAARGIVTKSAFDIVWKDILIGPGDDIGPLEEIPAQSAVGLMVTGNDGHSEEPEIYSIVLLCPSAEKCFFISGAGERAGEITKILNEKKPKFFGAGLKQSYYLLMRNGLDRAETLFDCEIAAYCLDPTVTEHSMKVLGLNYLGRNIPDRKELAARPVQSDPFSGTDTEALERLRVFLAASIDICRLQDEELRNYGLDKLAYEIEFPLIEVLASMEVSGIRADREVLENIGESLGSDISSLEKEIWDLSGTEFNINSTVQLGEVLFKRLGLKPKKKNKKGYSTSAAVLESLRDQHPAVNKILEYRTVTKLKSTYVDGLKPLIGPDGRIRAHFRQDVTATGRLSCTSPNLQNIPVRMPSGRKIRKAFVAGEGRRFVGADYSQIELRILASMSGDENLIADFREGKDIHRTTAARVFNVPYDEVTPLLRSRAKAVNFGVIYGMSGFGLSDEIDVSRKEAESYISDYFQKHPGVKKFMDDAVKKAETEGHSVTLYGRVRSIPELRDSKSVTRKLGERLAMNSPVQGTAADIIKIAMIRVFRELRDRGLKSRLILQIHDELIIETAEDELETVKELLKRNMENASELRADLVCDLNDAYSWYDLK